MEPAPVIILEGILIFENQRLRDLMDIKMKRCELIRNVAIAISASAFSFINTTTSVLIINLMLSSWCHRKASEDRGR